MEMDHELAERLVLDAVRSVVPDRDFDAHWDQLTLAGAGIVMPQALEAFKAYLMRFIIEAGFQIRPTVIPTDANDRLEDIMRVVELASVKSSGTTSKSLGDLPGESTKGNRP